MGWAGALEGIFKTYADDFGARPLRLFLNFRSQPALLRMQNDVIREIEADAVMPEDLAKGDGGEILAGRFPNAAEEAQAVANLIQRWISQEGIPPSQIAVLMPRQIEEYGEFLMFRLTELGIAHRNDHNLQDLLKEPAVSLVVDYLTCLYGQEQAEAWSRLMDHFTPFEDDDSRSSAQRIFEETYREHLKKVKQERKTANPYASWWDMANEFLKKLGFSSVSALSADYRSKARLLEIVREVRERIRGLLATEPDLLRALARLSDDSAVRFLTMHKSKGLEFHSVVVLGVEQQTFWGQLDQERCVFFVGISRAKNRLVLTTADYRPWPKNARRWDEHRAPHAEFVSHVVRHLTKQHF